jgi:hypothetical protein
MCLKPAFEKKQSVFSKSQIQSKRDKFKGMRILMSPERTHRKAEEFE